METERQYTPAEIDRLAQYERVYDILIRLSRRYERSGIFILQTDSANFRINSRFIFGVHLLRESLFRDLTEMGLKDDALDIMAKFRGH